RGTHQEIQVGDVAEVAEAVSVARAPGGRFPDARQLGAQADGEGGRVHRREYSLVKYRTSSRARSTPATGARARQPGTASTSRISPSPPGPGSRSTPATRAPTARAAFKASFSSGAARETFSAAPPWATLVRHPPPDRRRMAATTRPPRTNARRSQPGWAMN